MTLPKFKPNDSYTPGEIKALLSLVTIQVNTERELQDHVEEALRKANIAFEREARAGAGPKLEGLRFDFYLRKTRTVIETKTRDSRANVLRQLKRYADNPSVDRIIVMSRQPLSLPTQLSGKPIMNCELWRNFA